MNAYSLAFAGFLLFVGLLNVLIVRHASDNRRVMHAVTIVDTGMLGILLAVSVIYFIYPPTVAFAFCFLAFFASLVTGKRTNAH